MPRFSSIEGGLFYLYIAARVIPSRGLPNNFLVDNSIPSIYIELRN